MNSAIKTIILGFALILFGGFIFVSINNIQGDVPYLLFILSYNLYVGLFLIILGLLLYPKDDKSKN